MFMYECISSWLKCVGTWLPDAGLARWQDGSDANMNGTEPSLHVGVFSSLMCSFFWWGPASLSELRSFTSCLTQQCRQLFYTLAPHVWEGEAGETRLFLDFLEKEVLLWSLIYIFAMTVLLNPHAAGTDRWLKLATGVIWGGGVSRDCCSQQYVQMRQEYDFTKCTVEILVFNPFNHSPGVLPKRMCNQAKHAKRNRCRSQGHVCHITSLWNLHMYGISSQCVIWHRVWCFLADDLLVLS